MALRPAFAVVAGVVIVAVQGPGIEAHTSDPVDHAMGPDSDAATAAGTTVHPELDRRVLEYHRAPAAQPELAPSAAPRVLGGSSVWT